VRLASWVYLVWASVRHNMKESLLLEDQTGPDRSAWSHWLCSVVLLRLESRPGRSNGDGRDG